MRVKEGMEGEQGCRVVYPYMEMSSVAEIADQRCGVWTDLDTEENKFHSLSIRPRSSSASYTSRLSILNRIISAESWTTIQCFDGTSNSFDDENPSCVKSAR